MTNNYILRRLRYTLNLGDSDVIGLFAKGGLDVTREQVCALLKRDDDPDFVRCTDQEFAHFLNGLIVHRRGEKDGPKATAEYSLNNNMILRKLKIAFNMIDQDIIDLLKGVGFEIRKPELTAFFRNTAHKNYRQCEDQVLRNFLEGLQLRHNESAGGTADSPA